MDIYKMKLHEEKIVFQNNGTTHTITRVPGGWLYTKGYNTYMVETFVPYNEEFLAMWNIE